MVDGLTAALVPQSNFVVSCQLRMGNGKLVALLQGGGGGSGGHLILKVQSHIAQLLLDVTHDLTLGCRGTS